MFAPSELAKNVFGEESPSCLSSKEAIGAERELFGKRLQLFWGNPLCFAGLGGTEWIPWQ